LPSPSVSIGERRIQLWRRAIFLFDKSEKMEGPFHEAGYNDYWCEGRSQEKLTPDIFGFSDDFFCVCDISMSPQKGDNMGKYKKCTPSEYTKALFPSEKERNPTGSPFLITDEMGIQLTPGYNVVQVFQPGEATIDQINDSILEEKLTQWQGFFFPPPSYSLLAVPESTLDELKFPLAGILKWAAVQSEWVSINEVAEKLLGNLYSSFSKKGIANLRKNIETTIKDLSKGHLKEYLTYNNENKTFRLEVDVSNAQSKKAFSNRINSWLQITPIEIFDIDNETEEDEDTDSDINDD